MPPHVRYVLVLGLTVAAACSDAGPAGPHSSDGSQIIPFPSPLQLPKSASRRLAVTVLDSTGHLLDSVPLTYISSNKFVARVDSTGLVTAGNHGTATITISSPTASAVVNVTVSDSQAHPFRLTLMPRAPVLMTAGVDTLSLVTAVQDSDGNTLPSSGVVYRLSDSTVLRLAGGSVTGQAQGYSLLIASLDSLRDTVLVTVIQARTMLPSRAFGVAASQTGVLYASLPGLNKLVRIDPASHAVTTTISLPSSSAGLVTFNNAGTRAYVADRLGNGISVVDATTDHYIGHIATLAGDSTVTALVVPDGDSLLAVLATSNLYLVRLSTGTVSQVLTLVSPGSGIVAHGATIYLSYASYACCGSYSGVESYSLPTLQYQRGYFTNVYYAYGLALTPDALTLEVATGSQVYNQGINAASSAIVTTTYLLNYSSASTMTHNALSNRLVFAGGSSGATFDPSGSSKRVFLFGGTIHQVASLPDGQFAIANDGGWIDFIK